MTLKDLFMQNLKSNLKLIVIKRKFFKSIWKLFFVMRLIIKFALLHIYSKSEYENSFKIFITQCVHIPRTFLLLSAYHDDMSIWSRLKLLQLSYHCLQHFNANFSVLCKALHKFFAAWDERLSVLYYPGLDPGIILFSIRLTNFLVFNLFKKIIFTIKSFHHIL
jgi:hypothetical protein